MKRVYFVTAFIVAVFFSIPSAHTTEIIPSTLKYMTDFSDTIVVGTVSDKYSYWEGQKIFTNVGIDVEQFVKKTENEGSSYLQLKIPGGTVGDLSFHVDQAPEFKEGEKVMLFLKKSNSEYFPYGLSYGVYQIYSDGATGEEFINGPLFQTSEHYDLSTMQAVRNSELLGEKAFESFLGRVRKLSGE
jgi:hypothetical protein